MSLITVSCPKCGTRQRVSKLQRVIECVKCKVITRLEE